MKITEQQISSVIALSGPDRYRYFVKVKCDWEEVWGLYSDGWALATTEDGTSVFPM